MKLDVPIFLLINYNKSEQIVSYEASYHIYNLSKNFNIDLIWFFNGSSAIYSAK